jgi:hypothetical protein
LQKRIYEFTAYPQVYNLGAFKDWLESGGAIEKPIGTGM